MPTADARSRRRAIARPRVDTRYAATEKLSVRAWRLSLPPTRP